MYLPYNYTNAFFMPGLSYLRILKTRKIPLAPLMRVSRPSSSCPIIQVRPHCVTAPYHVPRPLHYEYTRQPPIRHLLIGPGQPLSVSTAPPLSLLLPQGLDLAFYRSPLLIDEDNETMDAESSTVDVLTSGTDTDVDMHDRAAQPSCASIVDVETEDLDTTPDILLDEITAGIAALSLTDNNEDHEIDMLTERMGALSIDDDAGNARLNMAMEVILTTPVQSPFPVVQPEPVAGPDVKRYNVGTSEDDKHLLAQSTAMMTLNESGPDIGPTTSQDADEPPPTPTLALSGGTRDDTPDVEATGTECISQDDLEALAPVHEVFLLTDDVENLSLDASTERTLRDDEADEYDSPSECVPPSLSIEDKNWDDLKPMQILVPKEEGCDPGKTSCGIKNPIDEDDENLFWNGPSLGTLVSDGHQMSAVDLRQCWSDEEELELKNIVALRRRAAPVFSLDEEDSEDEECSRPSSPTPCNYNGEWRLPFARKRVRSECEDSDEDSSSSPCAQRDGRRGDLRNGKRIRLSEESSVSLEKDACARRRAPRMTRSLRSHMRRGRRG